MDKSDKMKYPDSNEEIDVTEYRNLVLMVYNAMVKKFGLWIHKYKQDLVQTGYIGLLKAKEKYTPGRGSFLGLAYLRIMSAMQGEIAKYAKYEVNTTPVEGIKGFANTEDRDNLDWTEMFSGDIIDYSAVLRMIEDKDDQKLLQGVIAMYPYWKLRALLKESKKDHEKRVLRIKEELREILNILHPTQ